MYNANTLSTESVCYIIGSTLSVVCVFLIQSPPFLLLCSHLLLLLMINLPYLLFPFSSSLHLFGSSSLCLSLPGINSIFSLLLHPPSSLCLFSKLSLSVTPSQSLRLRGLSFSVKELELIPTAGCVPRPHMLQRYQQINKETAENKQLFVRDDSQHTSGEKPKCSLISSITESVC